VTTRSTQLLVIGGGATGLGIAWDACLRGLSVTIVEQGDLGQGTSGRYHGLLHSGGRYVLSDPASAADCRRENSLLRRLIPHAIEPTGGFFVSTTTDSPEYAAEWLAAGRMLGLPIEEISAAAALRREPLLSPRLTRVFEVQDAALDSFELLHALARGVSQAGGTVLLRHRVSGLVPHGAGLLARIVSLGDEAAFQLEAQFVVNAAGPFAGAVAAMAGAHLPLALGKGTMVAMASRLTHTVLNRCKPPHDGDVIVPVGTVCVLGTTDVPVRSPTDLAMEPWEIDLLLSEGQILIPTVRRHRALRAWAGIRALYRPPADSASHPGGDSASHPGGDSASYPGGDSASYPGGDSASYPGGDPGGEAAATGELAHKILAEVDTLNQMSQEMLDLAAIESGRQVIRLVAVPLQEIVAVPLERLREQAARQGVNLRAEIPTGLSVLADRDQAARAILNVLHNAVKFTPKGGSVSLTAAADPDGEHVILTVSDEGPGIAPAELGRIFERFFRGDQARGTPGTGLGLAITRHILQAHGGDVWAENRTPPASGAVVRLRFLTG